MPSRAVALTLACLLIGSAPTSAKQRAVGRGSGDIGANFLVPMVTAGDLVLTNHDTVPAIITACAFGCLNDAILPGSTRSYRFSAGVVQVRSSTDKLEGRTAVMDMVHATDLFTSVSAGALPLYAGKQELVLYSARRGSVDVQLRGTNGVWEQTTTMSVGPWFATLDLSIFGSVDGKQLELHASVPIGAFLKMIDAAGSTRYLPAQHLERAATSYLVLGATNQNATTRVSVKNPDPTAILGTNWEFYPAATEIRAPGKFNTTQTLNSGITTISDAVTYTGSTGTGMLLMSAGGAPFLVWATNGSRPAAVAPMTRGAIYRSYKLSIAGVTDDDTLAIAQANDTFDTVTCRLLGYDRDGKQLTTTSITLRGKENTYRTVRDLAPGASRIELEMNAPPAGSTLIPQATMATTNAAGYPRVGFQVVSIIKTTAQEYMNRWYPPNPWLNTVEAREIIQRRPHDLAVELSKSSSTPDVTATEEHLRSLVDGSTANGELWGGGDNFFVSITASKVELYTSSSTQPSAKVEMFNLPADAAPRIHREIVRTELARLVETYPERYGGNATTGPDLSFNPTWGLQN